MKIINHNNLTITEAYIRELTNYNPLDLENIEDYNSTHVGELYDNYIYGLTQLVDCPSPYDRTDEYNFLNIDFDPIPTIPESWNRKFEDIVNQRATELWNMDKPIRVWYSGGIDSSTALVALIRNKLPCHELSVWMSKPCVEENPTLYEKIKKCDITIQWNGKETIFKDTSLWDGSTLNITGECGDPMYGTFVIENHIEELDDHWHKTMDYDDVNFIYRDSPLREKFMNFTEEYVSKCPFEVKTPFDFTWWIAFTTKWQWIDRRLFGNLPDPSGYKNMLSFFNHPQFQIWSMTNHDLKHKGTYKTYKWPSKEYIHSWNKDEDYLNHKTKEKSLPKTAGNHNENSWHGNRVVFSDGTFYPIGGDIIPSDISIWELFNKTLCHKYRGMEISHV